MKVHHLRNACMVLSLGPHRILVDPMLSEAGGLPGFKVFGGGRRANPLVALPKSAEAALEQVTDVLITHEHPDHLDLAGVKWIKDRNLPVWASLQDVKSLASKGLNVKALEMGSLGMSVEVVEAKHGRGLVAWAMGPVAGYYLAYPGEPSIYLTSDAVLTGVLLEAVSRLKPDVIVAPAGSANFGAGGDILFSVDELVTLTQHCDAEMVFNHLEALDHCPTTRQGLHTRMKEEGVTHRVHIPEDGDVLHFEKGTRPHEDVEIRVNNKRPGFQKWVTAYFSGT